MTEILLKVIGLSAVIAIPTQSVLLGLNAGRPYLNELLSGWKILIKYAVTMFIIIPLVAVIFNFVFQDYRSLWIAVLIISIAPASPGMVKNILKLSGNYNISIAWMIFTIIFSIILIPFILLILENLFNINIDLGIDDVVLRMAILFLIPMGLGFLISKYLNKNKSILKEIISVVSKTAMLVLVICMLIIAVPLIIKNGIVPILLITAFILTALVISHFISLPERSWGPILPYSIVLRLPAPAIVLSQINNTMGKHLVVIITYTIMGILLMAIYNKIFCGKIITNQT
ncbi:MAG: hypothetical protein JSS91_12990 [Bacteroidetes bacterium]|nr:hypothetical protein [Bacteroidota bacterium]